MVSKKVIDLYLKKIINEKVFILKRISNMLVMGFGKPIDVINYKGEIVKLSPIALHVQCSWRIINKNSNDILFARMDIYEPCTSKIKTIDFDWEKEGENLFDEKSNNWLNKNHNVYVVNCYINELGDLKLEFSNNDVLEIMADASFDCADCWRIFEVDKNNKHLVMDGKNFILE